jgi:hypothetical protein
MPTNTPIFGIPKPSSSDFFTNANFNTILDAIESGVSGKVQMTKVTNDTGGATLSANTATDDILAMIVNAGVGMNTFFCTGAAINNPDGVNSIRGISHITGTGNGYAYAVGTDRTFWVNNYTSSVWGGWRAVSPQSYGLGSSALNISSTDLNNLDTTGFFQGASLINGPLTFTSGTIFMLRVSVNTSRQIFYVTGSTRTFTRYKSSGVWGAWAEIQVTRVSDETGAGISITGVDLDTLSDTGFYRGGTLTNGPSGITAGVVIHIKSNSTVMKQIFYDSSTDREFTRRMSSGVWQPWNEVVTTQTTAWTNLTLQNSWVNSGGTYPNASYRLNAMGEVELRGSIKSGLTTSGTTIATLPAGFRPTHDRNYVVYSTDGTNYLLATIQITSAGVIRIFSGGNAILSLDSIPPIATT